jgi:hypothetical protein
MKNCDDQIDITVSSGNDNTYIHNIFQTIFIGRNIFQNNLLKIFFSHIKANRPKTAINRKTKSMLPQNLDTPTHSLGYTIEAPIKIIAKNTSIKMIPK